MAFDHQLHVVMFPFFAFGHVSPFIQLSNKLSSHGVRITFLTIPGFVPRVKTLIDSSPEIEIIPLQISPSLGLPPNLAGTGDVAISEASKLITAIDLTRTQVETLLSELKPNLAVFDFAQHWLPSLASKLGIKTMYFSVFSAISMAYLVIPTRPIGVEGNLTVDDLIKAPQGFPLRYCSFNHKNTKITLFWRNTKAKMNNGDQSMVNEDFSFLKPFEAQSLVFAYKSYEDGSPSNYDRVQKGIAGCSAFIIKTCYEMEGPYLDFMKAKLNKRILLTGPLIPEPTPSIILDEKWANWLARFPAKSVVFCSFGSETFLTREQIRELALGLELTNLPFLLVLNFPKGVDYKAELESAMPLGFSERTKDKGLVHVGWIQQQLILEHVNVGCYLSHAGLSSLTEALVNDCQLVLLPQKLDQFFNSRLMGETGLMSAGVKVKTRDEDGCFGKEDIRAAVKTIMVDVDQEPGKSIRLNQKKWHDFMRDKKIQEKFISDMVNEMKRIVVSVASATDD